MFFGKLYKFSPSSDLSEVDLGDIIELKNGKRYLLVGRDPWVASLARFTWFDEWLVDAIRWLQRMFGKHTSLGGE